MLGSFTTGMDISAVLLAPNAIPIDLSGLTDLQWTPLYRELRSEPLDAPPLERSLPHGHRIRFAIDRNGSRNEALITAIEAGWWFFGGLDPGTSANGAAFFYINESDGSSTTWGFSGVSLKMIDGGTFVADRAVRQVFEVFARRKLI